MGCGHTEEKNEIEPDQIMVTSNKKNENNNNNYENSENKKDILTMKPKDKSKIKKFITDALKTHNDLREKHGVKPLKISEDLNQIAQKHAEHLAKINKIELSNNIYKNEYLGENLFCCSGNEIQGEAMTMSWYNEINKYNFNNPGFSIDAGHFTQIVWKDTKEVGFGFAKSKNGIYYGVANYFPTGNINNKQDFNNNVLQKLYKLQ